MKRAMTTEELGQALLREAQQMSEEEKAKVREQMAKEFGRPGTKRGDKIRLQ
jgi:hypothetical protein